MNLEEFIKKYTNKGIDWDGFYKFQCMDLYHQYCHEVLQTEHPSAPAAADLWGKTYKDFTKIQNTPEGVPQKGDIVIWSRNTGGGYGHVAIFVEGTVTKFTSFDQNWPKGSLCHLQGHYYTNVLGWLRPKTIMGDSSPELKECLRQHGMLVDENVKLKKELEDVRAEAKAQVEDFRREKGALEAEAKARNEEYRNFLSLVASTIGATQNESQIVAELGQLVKKDEEAQKAIDELRENQVFWNKKRIELEGEILKLKEQLKADDLSKYDVEILLRALIRRVINIVKSH